MTESAGVIAIEPFGAPRTPGSCGVPLPYTSVEAVDADGSRCAPGVSGILRVRGPNVSPGYTDARRDAGTFTGDGWLVSGDIGHLDADGRLFVDGREDEMVISGGENVFPREVEDVIARLAGVQDVAVIGVDDERFGQRLRAFVVLAPGARLSQRDVQQHVRSQLARFKVPRDVVFLDRLPRTATGKLLKRELGDPLAWSET
jgi:fatty-acyl-CoA synthase